jgi:hypothetical protein
VPNALAGWSGRSPGTMNPIEHRFRRQWLYAALVLVALRALHADGPGYDLSYQLAAAQNLLAGRGLALHQHLGIDLTDPPTLITLTHFPAGYSLVAAVLLASGLDVGLLVKTLAAVGTLSGWWGWAGLAVPFFREPLNRSRFWRVAAFVVATVTPLLFTPFWGGTDIFLWAIVPWVLTVMSRAADDTRGARRFDWLAGVLCGLAVLTRYASVFLAAYTVALTFWQTGLRPRALARRWGAFAVGFLPLVSMQLVINHVISNAPPMPGGVGLSKASTSRLLAAFSLLDVSNYSWAFWVPGKVMATLLVDGRDAVPWPLVLTAAGAMVLVAAAMSYREQSESAARDPRTISLGLFVAIPAMLCTAMIFSASDFVADPRQYLPLGPLSVFVAFSLVAVTAGSVWRPAALLTKTVAAAYAGAYTAMILLYIALSTTPTQIGNTERTRIMAGAVSRWPSLAVIQELSPARQWVMQHLETEPEADSADEPVIPLPVGPENGSLETDRHVVRRPRRAARHRPGDGSGADLRCGRTGCALELQRQWAQRRRHSCEVFRMAAWPEVAQGISGRRAESPRVPHRSGTPGRTHTMRRGELIIRRSTPVPDHAGRPAPPGRRCGPPPGPPSP